jgi:hypothetical protein
MTVSKKWCKLERICPSRGSIGQTWSGFGVDDGSFLQKQKLGVALELMMDFSCKNRVPETVEYYKKVPCNSARPHVDIVPDGSVTGTCLTHADTCIEEHASGVWF